MSTVELFNLTTLPRQSAALYSTSRDNIKFHVPRDKIDFQFSRSSGPGGQNVNKVNTKVEARFNVNQADWLSDHCKDMLYSNYRNNINSAGEFVINSSKYREQKLNLHDCIEKLERILLKSSIIPKERLPTDVPTYAQERRKKDKMFRSDIKAGRGKVFMNDSSE
ncbi:hypothetical protein SAMD00019534_074950 [Acytostelium subglobosum LB1]|uniref:hypothetical protein n=1 Tax=Acytostelium subglobosum LB1 TaxID=1410327 RepID=UPI000644F581|nr:hypothetical protein SAMD00019534_074950 [Acytostelium subglobosum LB1]GAM24320.1 hypothetical protein SAMD00019534_074950 [Acytostelium subglobosum LB1]|eukprot:XP_012752646.1 hypothetical protein SAMD00019534_074950 [Acytostelium subglobosum LB1]